MLWKIIEIDGIFLLFKKSLGIDQQALQIVGRPINVLDILEYYFCFDNSVEALNWILHYDNRII